MKKWLIALGLTSVLVIAGCGSESPEGENTNGQSSDQTEENSSTSDEQSTKQALLEAQMNIAKTFRPYHSKITAYQSAVSAEEPDKQAIQTAAKEAKTAAVEAAETASNYTIEANVSEEVSSKYKEALSLLQAYYEEVASALEENVAEADLTSADKKFTEFNDTLSSIYEDIGLLAPNMKKELS